MAVYCYFVYLYWLFGLWDEYIFGSEWRNTQFIVILVICIGYLVYGMNIYGSSIFMAVNNGIIYLLVICRPILYAW